MNCDFFISYRRGKDGHGIERAREVYNYLKGFGKTVFWDKGQYKKEGKDCKCIGPGKWWDDHIVPSLKSAKYVVLLVTDDFFKKVEHKDLEAAKYPVNEHPNDWFFEEIRIALDENKTIIPVLYDKETFRNIRKGTGMEAYPKYQHFKDIKEEQSFDANEFQANFKEEFESFINGIDNNDTKNVGLKPETNFDEDTQLVKRDDCVKSLIKLLKKDRAQRYFNLYALGGYGKSSLINLMAFYKEKEDGYYFRRVWKVSVKGDLPNFKDIRKQLEQDSQKDDDTSRNLFVIDIDSCPSDRLSQLAGDLQRKDDEARLYPKEWNVLVVTRHQLDYPGYEPFCINYYLEKIEYDIRYLKKMFVQFSKTSDIASELLSRVFERMCYNPMLVKILANKIRIEKSTKLLQDIADDKISVTKGFNKESLLDPSKTEENIEEYAKVIVDYDNLSFNSRLLLSFFMLWRPEYISKVIVKNLIKGYDFLRTDAREAGFFQRKISLQTNDADSDAVLDAVFAVLVDRHLLEKSDDGESYFMHAFVGDVLRNLLLGDVNRKNDYNRYTSNCYSFLRDSEYFNCISSSAEKGVYDERFVEELKKVDEYQQRYIEYEIKKQIALIPKTEYSQLADMYFKLAVWQEDVMNLPVRESYRQAIANYLKIKNPTDAQNLKLAEAYCRIGYLLEPFEKLNASEYYCKALDVLYNVQHLDKSGQRLLAALKCKMVFDKDTNYDAPIHDVLKVYEDNYEHLKWSDEKNDCRFVKESRANMMCRLGDSMFNVDNQRAWVCFEKSVSSFKDFDYRILSLFSQKNMADANYRYGFLEKRRSSVSPQFKSVAEMITMDSYEKEKQEFVKNAEEEWKNITENTIEYFDKADIIWQGLPVESDGDWDGFVKTSYGLYDPEFGFKLVKVEKGSFMMGMSEEDEIKFKDIVEYDKSDEKTKKLLDDFVKRETPCHNVTITEDFYIGMFPVTKGQWYDGRGDTDNDDIVLDIERYYTMKDDALNNELLYLKSTLKVYKSLSNLNIGGDYNMDSAMTYVSYEDATLYVKRINEIIRQRNKKMEYRLPSEAEWEYAARGGKYNSERTLFSGCDNIFDVAIFEHFWTGSGMFRELVTEVSASGSSDVGLKKPNELGIYDMSGNVLEWCQDWYNSEFYSRCMEHPELSRDPYCEEQEVIKLWDDSSGPARVLRGGAWRSSAQYCRVSNRSRSNPACRSYASGLRLLLSSPKNKKSEGAK